MTIKRSSEYMDRLLANVELCRTLEQSWAHEQDVVDAAREYREELETEIKELGYDV